MHLLFLGSGTELRTLAGSGKTTPHSPLPTPHYLSFNVANPTSTSNIVMIQNLTTT